MADTMNPVGIYISRVTICTKVPHLEQGTTDDDTKQTQTLAMICEQYPPEAWTNVYTDGSATVCTLGHTKLISRLSDFPHVFFQYNLFFEINHFAFRPHH